MTLKEFLRLRELGYQPPEQIIKDIPKGVFMKGNMKSKVRVKVHKIIDKDGNDVTEQRIKEVR